MVTLKHSHLDLTGDSVNSHKTPVTTGLEEIIYYPLDYLGFLTDQVGTHWVTILLLLLFIAILRFSFNKHYIILQNVSFLFSICAFDLIVEQQQ